MTDVVVPKAVALKGVPDVELVAVGRWNAGTGVAVITDDDVRSAVAALECPGIHNPVLKLGHQEPDPDAQRNRWDGAPAVGWIANMRLSENGAKVLGDYTGVPAWLVDVMPSAYPQRSIELHRNFQCQIGHVHPFVITAVSLLGEYPPAVGVIKSLHDVQALYTLAAHDGHPAQEVTRSISIGLAAAERRPPTDVEVAAHADFDTDRDQWDAAVDALLSAYGVVQRRQREQLTAQIAPLIDSGDYTRLSELAVDSEAAAELIYAEMLAAAQEAIDLQIVEAAAQGIIGLTAVPDELYLRRTAEGIAAAMATTLASTAGRDAAQMAAPGASGRTVAATVDEKLSDLSDQFLRDQFNWAVGGARMSGRYEVLSVAPNGAYYASELNDANTCDACRQVDGTRFADLAEAMGAYGAGSYQQCAGRGRCRGRLVAVWEAATRPELFTVGIRVGGQTLLAKAMLHLPGEHNQKTHGDGGSGGGKPSKGGAASKAHDNLMAGKNASIGRDDLPDLLGSLAGAKAVNLSRLAVDGEKNLFRKHAREIPRAEMPQLPTKTHLLAPFTDALAERGITGELEEVDPRTLTATQSELDSAKVGQMYARAKEGTLNREAIAFISRDGFILDGHHRWAALAAAQATGTDSTMKVIRLDTDIDTLLEVANTVSGPRKTVGATT